ncbi:MAG: M61 family metallopeptidase, partial [Clostridia bacterium]
MTITYEVDCTAPERQVYHVTLTLGELAPGLHVLTLPVWGAAYEVRDFARHLFGLEVTDPSGVPMGVVKTAKNTWEFEAAASSATVTYHVYANELVVESSHLDATHAYWSGHTLFFIVDGVRDLPIDLFVRVPVGWHISTGLDPAGAEPGHYRAPHYDHLVDCPVEAGTHPRYRFMVQGKRHEIAVWGHGNEEPDRLVSDVRRIVETASSLFGGLPYKHYTFLVHLTEGGGGVEHRNSTTCQTSPLAFKPWSRYKRTLNLFAHEFFHLWNVKRIRPAVLDRPDYNREVYTRLLWAMEGVTSYYAPLLLRRAGLYSVEDYTETLADAIKSLESKPGRRVMSAAHASFDTWMANYDQGPDVANRAISYYLKGSLVGFVLDMEIRRRTLNRRSLDDVLRLLYERYAAHGVGFSEGAYQAAAEDVAGGSLAAFFARYVEGVDELPVEAALSLVGLALRRTHPATPHRQHDPAHLPAWLGVEFATRPPSRAIATVFNPGPAAGILYPGDEIVALDGLRTPTVDAVEARIQTDWRPGESVSVHVFRRGRLEAVTVALGAAPPGQY